MVGAKPRTVDQAAIVRTLVHQFERFVQFADCARSLAEQLGQEGGRVACFLRGAANHLAETVREDETPEERSGIRIVAKR